MKSSYQLKISPQSDRQQLYHKHTFGSVGNVSPTIINSNTYTNFPLSQSFTNSSATHSIPSSQSPTNQISLSQIPVQNNQPIRRLQSSTLSTAISSLTYGLSCLIFQVESDQVYQCLIMIHQEYINILHLIINRSISYLLKLHQIKSIDNQDTYMAGKIAVKAPQMRDNYIVLNLKSLKTVVLLFKTDNQKQIVFMGLKFFLNQGRSFYQKLSQYNPFRAQSMMLFLQADKDGGNLLNIDQITDILSELKINKQRLDIQADVLQINKSLYQRQNMKRPKNASSHQLTPIAFQYLLRYYSMKQQLSKFFKQYCQMFKPKIRNHKNTIIDIIKNNQKPIMSAIQLKDFYKKVLNQQKTINELNQVIGKFPLYDGQGKQKFQFDIEQPLLNFDNFCNLVCSRLNGLIELKNPNYDFSQVENDSDLLMRKSKIRNPRAYLGRSLLDYYIYSDLSVKNPKRHQKSNYFNLALKRGVKCITLTLNISSVHHFKGTAKTKNLGSKLSALIVKTNQKQLEEYLVDDILRQVKSFAFEKNKLPFWIVFDIYQLVKHTNYQQYLELLSDMIEQCLEKQTLFVNQGQKQDKKNLLPSPLDLQGKIILLTNFNAKLIQKMSTNKNQTFQIPQSLNKKLSFSAVKLDFQRKGQNCWNSCFIQQDILKSCQTAQEQNIANYGKKLMLFYTRKPDAQPSVDSFACFRQGIHFVGQDFERNKEANYIIHSKFLEVPDEAFGYILKPQYMHTQNNAPLYSNKNFTKSLPTCIKFNILSGQKIILNDLPYKQFHVQIFIKGCLLQQQNNKIYKSQKKTQGFYTQINLQCEFVVYNEEMFTIVIVVRNSQNNKILGERAVSLNRMRQGLRTLQLLNDRMQTKENSYLLVHYTKKLTQQKDQRANKMNDFLK